MLDLLARLTRNWCCPRRALRFGPLRPMTRSWRR